MTEPQEQPPLAETTKPEKEKAVKEPKESPYAVILKRLENIEAKLDPKSAQTSKIQSPITEKAPLEPAPNQTEGEHNHTEEGKPHYVGPWQAYCPTCGDKNPDFKDEIVCDTCGQHLGAEKTAITLKACPNCGGKKASRKK